MAARPGLLHQVRIGLCDLTLHAQWVAEVELLKVAIFEKVLSELWHVAEALQGQGHGNEVNKVETEKKGKEEKKKAQRDRGKKGAGAGERRE